MRTSTRRPLRHVLQLEDLSIEPRDLLEPLPQDNSAHQQREAKRRRIETIANQYLVQGTLPLIRSAQLRGPFGDKWKNPWRKVIQADGRKSEEKGGNRDSRKKVQNKQKTRKRKSRDESSCREYNNDSVIPAPSRESSNPTEFFSANTVVQGAPSLGTSMEDGFLAQESSVIHCPQEKSPKAPENWLKRRNSVTSDEVAKPSPTPSRKGNRPISSSGTLQLALPSATLLEVQSHPTQAGKPLDNARLQSSASASMVISSPARQEPRPQLKKRATDNAQGQFETESYIPPHDLPNSSVQTDVVSFAEGIRSAKRLTHLAVQRALSSSPRQTPPTRQEIRRLAQRCAIPTPQPHGTKVHGSKSRRNLGKESQERVNEKSLFGSFTYKKVEGPRKGNVESKSKPRPVTFDSSPIPGRHPSQSASHQSKSVTLIGSSAAAKSPSSVNHGEVLELSTHRPDVYDMPGDDHASGRNGLSKSIRQSNFSTQAAMMLAQLEFQEDSISPGLAGDHDVRIELPSDGTDVANGTCEPSPAVTPFHVFNAQLKQMGVDSPESGQEPPISTQDLFNAASPFAFSTAKKRSTMSRRSNLRFAVHSAGEEAEPTDREHGTRSPTPSAERVPLKERNSHVAFKSFKHGSEKGSQESLGPSPIRPPTNAFPSGVELPQLNFQDSMNGDLDFTDRFLRNLKDMI